MNGLKITLAWLFTVITGSIFFPISMFGGRSISSISLGIIIIAVILSSIISLPTLITLLVVQAVNTGKSLKTQMKRIILAHLIMLIVTIGVGDWIIYLLNMPYSSGPEPLMGYIRETAAWSIIKGYTTTVAYYAGIAVVIWALMFRKSVKAALAETPDQALDAKPVENL